MNARLVKRKMPSKLRQNGRISNYFQFSKVIFSKSNFHSSQSKTNKNFGASLAFIGKTTPEKDFRISIFFCAIPILEHLRKKFLNF